MSRKRGLSVLVTVLFTDIVGSTEIAAELGDKRWRDLVRRHHAIVRRELKRFRGRELDTAGDGFFARFDRPADAIRCACAISDGVRELGIEIRAGIHVGEAEVFEHKVGGIAVNVAARVMGVAKGGEVLVSSTLRDAVAGSGVAFADHGTHRLKGIEGEWRLYEVTSVEDVRRALPLSAEEARDRRGFAEAVPVGRGRGSSLASRYWRLRSSEAASRSVAAVMWRRRRSSRRRRIAPSWRKSRDRSAPPVGSPALLRRRHSPRSTVIRRRCTR
jgi:class 3 adenylate cyclase